MLLLVGVVLPHLHLKDVHAADSTTAAQLQTATALQAQGELRWRSGQKREALNLFKEAYRIRLGALGPFHPKSYESLEATAANEQEPKERLKLLLELETATTNTFRGQAANEKLSDVYESLAAVYRDLGMTAQQEAAENRKYRLMGMSDEQIAEHRRSVAKETKEAEEFIAQTEKQLKPIMDKEQQGQERLVQEKLTQLLNDPKMVAILKASTQMQRSMDEQLGATPEQLKEVDKASAAQARWVDEITAKARAGTMTEADWAAKPRDAVVKLPPRTNFHTTKIQGINFFRRVEGDVAARDPENYRLLREMNVFGAPRASVEKWFQNEWEHWNNWFEEGEPFNRLMANKGNGGPFAALPVEAETNGVAMSLLALNLKGLVIERELRLHRELATSKDPNVATWRARLWQTQVEALRTRPQSIDLKPSAPNSNPLGKLVEFTGAFEANRKVMDTLSEIRVLGLALPGARRSSLISDREVTQALPERSVLVEFLRYGRDLGGTNLIDEHYSAIILNKDAQPRAVYLAPAAAVDVLVARYVELMGRKRIPSNDETRTVLEESYRTIWKPIETALPKNPSVIYLAPDSQLHLVSFATLLREGRFLCQQPEILGLHYVTGGRDLLAKRSNQPGNRRMEIWVDPDVDRAPATSGKRSGYQPATVVAGMRSGGFLTTRFGRLGPTATDATTLKEIAERHGNLTVRTNRDLAVSETALAQVAQPYILHIGAHGFFRPMQRSESGRSQRTFVPWQELTVDVPFYRCGLALAGANRTLESWNDQTIAAPDDDGILTAAEAGQMNLHGTWLVTLSACDTGIGGVIDGECVLSLKLGFLQAGAQNLAFSLWRLNDAHAHEFMGSFYTEALASGNAPAALAKVQKDRLSRLASRDSNQSLWESVRYAGPFILTTRGQP